MLIRLFYLSLLLMTSAALLYGSVWMFGEEVLKFGAAIGVMIKAFFVQLSKLTIAGVVKYLGAHVVRFLSIEWWKYFVIKWLKGFIIPFIFGTVIGAKVSQFFERRAYQTRKYRVLFKRWYRRQNKFIQVVFWAVSGVIILILTIQIIGLGFLATAVKLPIWAYKFVMTLTLKLWGIVQRTMFRSLMFIFTKVFVWKRAQNYLRKKHGQRMRRLTARLNKHKTVVIKKGTKIIKGVSSKDEEVDEGSPVSLEQIEMMDPKSEQRRAAQEALQHELMIRGRTFKKK